MSEKQIWDSVSSSRDRDPMAQLFAWKLNEVSCQKTYIIKTLVI